MRAMRGGESVAAGLADAFAAAFVFVIGGDIADAGGDVADAGMQPHGAVLIPDPVEFSLELAGVADFL